MLMTRLGWFALLIMTIAGCGELEGAGNGEPVETVSSPIVFNGHDYYFFNQQVTWTGAKSLACPDSYRLVSINSPDENEFVRTQALKHANGPWWIGYSDQTLEGLWLWDNGDSPGYVNWATPGEPRNAVGNEDCAVIDAISGRWSAKPCADGVFFANFVCERSTIPTAETDSFEYQATNTNNAQQNYAMRAVNMTRNWRITLGTCGLNHADSDGDTFLRLFNPFGVEVASNDDACNGFGSNLSYLAPSTGTYYIHAGCFSNNTCGGTPLSIRTECIRNCPPSRGPSP